MNWRERAKRARLTHGFIADALGYANRAKISQAFGWDSGVPIAIRLFIVMAERLPPTQLTEWIAEAKKEEDLPAAPKESGSD